MPPVSEAASEASRLAVLEKSMLKSSRISLGLMVGSTLSVFTDALLRQEVRLPQLYPVIPPVRLSPVTLAFRTAGAERSVIHTRNATGIGLTDNGSDERTVFNRTIVFPRNTAHGQSVAAGGDNSLNRQVFDYRRWLQDSKQSGGRQALGQRKTADGMSAAVEAAAEGGYGGKIRFLQRNIRREQHLLIL